MCCGVPLYKLPFPPSLFVIKLSETEQEIRNVYTPVHWALESPYTASEPPPRVWAAIFIKTPQDE